MNLKILHQTKYFYSTEVFIEPHILRFKPKQTVFCDVKSFRLDISPDTTGLSEHFDTENNLQYFCWFDGLHKELIVEAESLINIKEYNPFNFLIHPVENIKLPFQYNLRELDLLKNSLVHDKLSSSTEKYLMEVERISRKDSLEFILLLTRTIHDDFHIESREEGEPLNASVTFNQRSGSCRDLAWMEIQMLRSRGLASRFVSGYYYFEMENPAFELHAWLEVYIPGAGWIGFDPSHGVITGNTHIPVCQSACFENTMPVTGSIRGDAKTKMETELIISHIN